MHSSRSPREGLFGRSEELLWLREHLDTLDSGRGSALLLVGPAGTGKSALLLAFARLAQARGAAVLIGKGAELQRAYTYGVVRELLERPLEGRPDNDDRSWDEAREAAHTVFDSPDAVLRSAQSRAVLLKLFEGLAEGRRLVVLVDDVQWADPSSLALLAELAQRADRLPLLLAVTACDEHSPPELAEILARANFESREVGPLEVPVVADMLLAELGARFPPPIVQACFDGTGGNPAQLKQLVARLSVTPAAELDVSRVRELAREVAVEFHMRQLARLSPAARELAGALLVLGANGSADEAARVAELSALELEDASAALRYANLIDHGSSTLRLTDPLVAEATRRSLGSVTIGQAHGRAAQILAEQGADVERIAAHLTAAAGRGDPHAVDVLRRAASHAIDRGAPAVSVKMLRRALEEPPPEAVRGRIMFDLAMASATSGGSSAIEDLLAAQQAVHGVAAKAQCARFRGRLLLFAGRLHEAMVAYQEAVQLQEEADDDEALVAKSESLSAMRLGLATAAEASARAAQLEPEFGRSSSLGGRALSAFAAGHRLFSNAPMRQVLGDARHAIEEQSLLESRSGRGVLFYVAVLSMLCCDDYGLATTELEKGLMLARDTGSGPDLALALSLRAALCLREGDLQACEQAAVEALEHARRHDVQLAAAWAVRSGVEAMIERADLAGAEHLIDAAAVSPSLGPCGDVLYAEALLHVGQHRSADAIQTLRACAEHMRAWKAPSPMYLPWQPQLAMALAAAGDQEAAREQSVGALAAAREAGSPRAIGVALRSVALSDPGGVDTALLEDSVAQLRHARAPLELARSLFELGGAMRRTKRPVPAREFLAEALAVSERCGALRMSADIQIELRVSRSSDSESESASYEGLTPSEERVARLAAAGLSNKSIASTLRISPRTVQHHLSRTFSKLGVATRQQLQAALSEAEPEPTEPESRSDPSPGLD